MGGNGLIRIKVPTELSVLGTILAMVASDNVMGTKYSKEDYKDALTNWIPTQFNITDPVRMFFSWFSPAVKIPIELIANFKDYPRIKPLENQSMQNKEPKERYNEYTSPLAKLIGEKFNLSPIKIDFLIEGILGRASRYVTGKKGAYDVLSQGYRDYFFTIGRRVTNFYDDMDRNSQHWKTLSDKYKGVSNIPDEVKQDIKLTNRKRIAYNFVNDLLSEMRKIDEKKEPGKLKWYREKIIIGLEKISEIK